MMSDELQTPPVIDLEVLLQPISDESPSGESLRYSGIYDELAEARRADDDLNKGDWVTEVKVADYGKVINIGVEALSTQTKDVQIGVWVAEAVIRKHGLAGFRDGLLMLNGFLERFWETLHPEIDEGDMEGRANAMSWLDIHGAEALRRVPFTGSKGYNFIDLENARKYDFPEFSETQTPEEQARLNELRTEAEKNRSVTMSHWNQERSETRRAAMEVFNRTAEECLTAFGDLNRLCEEKFDRNQTPGFSNLKKVFETINEQIKKLLEEKRLEEPDELEVEQTAGANEDGSHEGRGDLSVSGAIASRKDALRRLGEIAAFFQKTEPHSPVSYLVQRAVKWGNMGLETWLQDVIKDQSVLFQLRETLGVDGGGSSTSSDTWSEPAPADDGWGQQ